MAQIKRKAFLPVLIMAMVILTLSSIPSLAPPSIDIEFEDKIAHFAEYSILGFLAARAIWISKIPRPKHYLFAVGACSLFAVFDEIHQIIIPNRTTDIFDMAADMLGAVAGIIFASWWYGRKSRSRRT